MNPGQMLPNGDSRQDGFVVRADCRDANVRWKNCRALDVGRKWRPAFLSAWPGSCSRSNAGALHWAYVAAKQHDPHPAGRVRTVDSSIEHEIANHADPLVVQTRGEHGRSREDWLLVEREQRSSGN
jgi:hypothetical protein